MIDLINEYWLSVLVVCGAISAIVIFGKNLADLILKWRQVNEDNSSKEETSIILDSLNENKGIFTGYSLDPLEVQVLKLVVESRGGRTGLSALEVSLGIPSNRVVSIIKGMETRGYVVSKYTPNGTRIESTKHGMDALFNSRG